MPAARPAQAGFTMVELVVVLVIIGILAVVAAPALVQRSALSERAVADGLRSLLRQARSLAVAQQREVCVIVAPPQARVVYASAGACNPAQAVASTTGTGPLQLELPLDVNVGGATQVRFNARGQPMPAASRTLSVGAQTLTVHLETGAVL